MIKLILRVILAAAAILLLAGALIFFARRAQAARELEGIQASSRPQKLGDIGSTRSLTILPLYEKGQPARPGLISGHGVSYLIRTDQTTILLDLGNRAADEAASPLEANMRALGITLEEIDALYLSHNHPDHVGGTRAWQGGTFAATTVEQPLPFSAVYAPTRLTYPGLEPFQAAQAAVIAPGVATMGVLPFLNPFPLDVQKPLDFEQTLAVHVEGQGIVLITGCGHPGLEAIVDRAEKLFDQPVTGIVGGLHYGEASAEATAPHVEYLATRSPRLVALSPHDSGPRAIDAFRQAFPSAYRDIQVGQVIQFP